MPIESMRIYEKEDKKLLSKEVRRSLEILKRKMHALPERDFGNSKLHSAATHLLRRNAKLIRAALLLTTAEILGQKTESFIELAMAVELLHTSSLIHDDIIDKDTRRSGIATVHAKYGDEVAILAGNALISRAIQMSSKYGPDVVSFLSEATMRMCAGEIMDFEYQQKGSMPDMGEYYRIVDRKCASLIAASCSLVALYRNDKSFPMLQRFGEYLGTAFQIRDDILDFSGDVKAMRGPAGVYKPNLVSIVAEREGLKDAEALRRAVELANGYLERARAELPQSRRFSVLGDYSRSITVQLRR